MSDATYPAADLFPLGRSPDGPVRHVNDADFFGAEAGTVAYLGSRVLPFWRRGRPIVNLARRSSWGAVHVFEWRPEEGRGDGLALAPVDPPQ